MTLALIVIAAALLVYDITGGWRFNPSTRFVLMAMLMASLLAHFAVRYALSA